MNKQKKQTHRKTDLWLPQMGVVEKGGFGR